MKTSEFKALLDLYPDHQPHFKLLAKSDCISNCKLVEEQYSDLDAAYESDKGVSLLASLPDSTHEESQIKQSVIYYLQFRDYEIMQSMQISKTEKIKLDNEIQEIEKSTSLSQDQKQALIKNSIDKSALKNKLLAYWGGCAVTGCSNPAVLLVTIIKPLTECVSVEKYDLYNYLLLIPTYSILFEKRLISFDTGGRIMIDDSFADAERLKLGISGNERLNDDKFMMNHAYYLDELIHPFG